MKNSLRKQVEEIIAPFTDFKECKVICNKKYLYGGAYNCQQCVVDRILAIYNAEFRKAGER